MFKHGMKLPLPRNLLSRHADLNQNYFFIEIILKKKFLDQ